MAVLRARVLARRHLDVLEAGADRSYGPAQVAPRARHARALARHRLALRHVDDRGWPWRVRARERVRQRRRAELGLADELDRDAVDQVGQRLDGAASHQRESKPREAHAFILVALAEREQVERL